MTDNLCQIMQNKANLLDTQMQVSFVVTKDYENATALWLRKNKANQSQFQTLLLWIPENQTQTNPISNLTLLKWVIMRENALDIMASATKNVYLMGLNKNRKNRKKEANAAIYAFNQAIRFQLQC